MTPFNQKADRATHGALSLPALKDGASRARRVRERRSAWKGAQVITVGSLRPVRSRMPARLLAMLINSPSAC